MINMLCWLCVFDQYVDRYYMLQRRKEEKGEGSIKTTNGDKTESTVNKIRKSALNKNKEVIKLTDDSLLNFDEKKKAFKDFR